MTGRATAAALCVAVLVPLAGCSSDSASGADRPGAPLSSAALEAGLRVTLSAEQASPGAAQVTLRAVVADDDGAGPGYTVDFGDGKTTTVPVPTASCAASRSAAAPLTKTLTLQHRYAKPGTYPVSIEVTSGSSCELPASETQTALALVSVTQG